MLNQSSECDIYLFHDTIEQLVDISKHSVLLSETPKLKLLQISEWARQLTVYKKRKSMFVLIPSGAIILVLTLILLMLTSSRSTYIRDGDIPLVPAGFGSGISIPSIDEISISYDSTVEIETLFNPEVNSCWFIFELILVKTGETLFVSELTAPGDCISNVIFKGVPPSGKHEARLIIRALDFERCAEIDVTDILLTLHLT